MSRKQPAAEVTLPSDREVEVRRSFRAPRALVWDAYTKPELLKRWLGTAGWSMPVCEMDVREGGSFRWRWRSDEDGSEFGFHGEFLEVRSPELLRNTETFDPGDAGGSMGDGPAHVTVRLEESGGVTTMISRMKYASAQDRDAALATGMTDGMEVSYQHLDELLPALSASGASA